MSEHICELYEDWSSDQRLLELGEIREEIIRCRDCEMENTMRCPIKRALVYDGLSESDCVAPGGYCAWAVRA